MPDAQAPEQILAERLNLLLDIRGLESGERPQYPEIRDAMEARGFKLSRQRWHYMRSGTFMTTDRKLLEALADHFGVPLAYLVDIDPVVPEKVKAQLELLNAMHEAEVKNFALRSFTPELSAETLLEIRGIIDNALGEQGKSDS